MSHDRDKLETICIWHPWIVFHRIDAFHGQNSPRFPFWGNEYKFTQKHKMSYTCRLILIKHNGDLLPNAWCFMYVLHRQLRPVNVALHYKIIHLISKKHYNGMVDFLNSVAELQTHKLNRIWIPGYLETTGAGMCYV